MKPLEQYIKEHLSKEEFIEQIKNMEYDDFRKLKKLYLRKDNKTFKDDFINFCKTKNIEKLKMFWSYFDDFSGRKDLINKMSQTSDNYKYTNLLTIEDLIANSDKKNIFDLIVNKIYPESSNNNLKNNFINILKEIALDDKRTKKTAAGKFEHLLSLFLDGEIQPGNGDIILKTADEKTTHIEVKYCKNADFGAYRAKTLTKSNLEEISNEENLDNFLHDYLDNKYEDNEKFLNVLKNNLLKTNNTNIITFDTEKLKKYFLCLQFYLYINNQFKNTDNQYLMLFKDVNKDSNEFGEYKLIDVKDIKDKETTKEDKVTEIIKFVDDNLLIQNVNRNKVEFTLK